MYEKLKAYSGYYRPALIAVVILVLVFFAGYSLGLRNVHDNGAGVKPIGDQLDKVGTDIQDAKSGIDAAEVSAGKVADGITSAQESAQYVETTVDESGRLIGECKQILARIRARGKADTR